MWQCAFLDQDLLRYKLTKLCTEKKVSKDGKADDLRHRLVSAWLKKASLQEIIELGDGGDVFKPDFVANNAQSSEPCHDANTSTSASDPAPSLGQPTASPPLPPSPPADPPEAPASSSEPCHGSKTAPSASDPAPSLRQPIASPPLPPPPDPPEAPASEVEIEDTQEKAGTF